MGEPHVHGWAAIVTTLTADPALSPDKTKFATTYMASVSSPEALLQSVYWNQFKKTFQKYWVKWQCSVNSKTQTIMHFIIKAMVSRKAKEKVAQTPAGGGERARTPVDATTCRASRRQKGTAVADFPVTIEFSAGGQQRRTAVADLLDATKEVAHRKPVSVVRTLWRLCWRQAHRAALPCGLFETGAVR